MGKNEIILCDSNIIIRLFRGDQKIQEQLNQIGFKNVALSLITHAEVYFGTSRGKIAESRKILEAFMVCHLDTEISKVFNGLILNYTPIHHIKIPDALIAATAIANNFRLFTDNKKDFDFIPEIKFYDPKY